MSFTAPAAGIYYLNIVTGSVQFATQYTLFVTGGPHGALGGLNILGDYGFPDVEAPKWTDISVLRGGDLGAVRITGNSYNTSVSAESGGDLVVFEAGVVGRPMPMALPPPTALSATAT